MLRAWLALLCLVCAVPAAGFAQDAVAGAGAAGTVASPPPQQTAERKAYEVKLHDTLVFRLWVDRPWKTAPQRARDSALALERAFDAGWNDSRIDVHADARVIFVGDVPVVELYEADARAAES